MLLKINLKEESSFLLYLAQFKLSYIWTAIFQLLKR